MKDKDSTVLICLKKWNSPPPKLTSHFYIIPPSRFSQPSPFTHTHTQIKTLLYNSLASPPASLTTHQGKLLWIASVTLTEADGCAIISVCMPWDDFWKKEKKSLFNVCLSYRISLSTHKWCRVLLPSDRGPLADADDASLVLLVSGVLSQVGLFSSADFFFFFALSSGSVFSLALSLSLLFFFWISLSFLSLSFSPQSLSFFFLSLFLSHFFSLLRFVATCYISHSFSVRVCCVCMVRDGRGMCVCVSVWGKGQKDYTRSSL